LVFLGGQISGEFAMPKAEPYPRTSRTRSFDRGLKRILAARSRSLWFNSGIRRIALGRAGQAIDLSTPSTIFSIPARIFAARNRARRGSAAEAALVGGPTLEETTD